MITKFISTPTLVNPSISLLMNNSDLEILKTMVGEFYKGNCLTYPEGSLMDDWMKDFLRL